MRDPDSYPELADQYGRLYDDLRDFVVEALDQNGEKRIARMGYLPQGAPTSPMLANLVVHSLDDEIQALAEASGLTYTRYADDMAFSTPSRDFDYARAKTLVASVYGILARNGLRPNLAKTRIRGPGSRKVVLGLGVDATERPRLTRELRDRVRMHFYYINKIGPAAHAKNRGFPTVFDLRRHIEGLVFFARDIDKNLGNIWLLQYNAVPWPV
jgi:RNA-directed DNA polymerase